LTHTAIALVTVARVVGVNGLELTLDNSYANVGTVRVRIRTQTGEATNLLTGEIDGNILTLSTNPGVPIYTALDGQEATTVVLGQEVYFRRSYMVSEINPTTSGISVKATGYSEDEYVHVIPGEAI
jgi:hypothetical protein